MASVDFKLIVDKSVPGLTIVHSMTEEAFEFITTNLQFGYLPNGDVAWIQMTYLPSLVKPNKHFSL